MAARQLGLIGAAAMFDAIGEAGVHLLAAEVEIGLARVAHRPAAHLVRQIEQRGLAGDLGAGLGWHKAARRCGRAQLPVDIRPLRVTEAVVARSKDFRFLVPTVGLSLVARAGTPIAQDGDRGIGADGVRQHTAQNTHVV